MNRTTTTIVILSFFALCGAFALGLVLLSPAPMPPANEKLLGALLVLLSTAGTTLLAYLAGTTFQRGNPKPPNAEGAEG